MACQCGALSMLEEKDFEVFVSALICKDNDELQKQFILINNTRPLAKELIYELLPVKKVYLNLTENIV